MLGLATTRSSLNVAQTVAAIQAELDRRGIPVAVVVDHSAAARRAGLELPATRVVVFGDPKAGTPLMQAVPEIAVELPLRVVVRDDGGPGALVTWPDPSYLAQRYSFPRRSSPPSKRRRASSPQHLSIDERHGTRSWGCAMRLPSTPETTVRGCAGARRGRHAPDGLSFPGWRSGIPPAMTALHSHTVTSAATSARLPSKVR